MRPTSTRTEIGAFLALDQASVSGVALAGYRDDPYSGWVPQQRGRSGR